MFRNNTNIIGFLQKKQFFNRSPSPSPNPSPNSRFNTNPSRNLTPSRNITPPKTPHYDTTKAHSKTAATQLNSYEANPSTPRCMEKNDGGSGRKETGGNFSGGRQSKGRAFQSSRVEVKMCMEELSSKVGVELKQLQGAITELTVSLQSIFYRKLGELRQELNRSVDEVFAQARANLNNALSAANEQHLRKLLKSKHHLSEAQRKLQELKATLDTNWRQAAGELFATSLDQKIEQLLQQSQEARRGGQSGGGKISGVIGDDGWDAIARGISGLIQRRCR